jgi:hypothetical protein
VLEVSSCAAVVATNFFGGDGSSARGYHAPKAIPMVASPICAWDSLFVNAV